MDESYTVLSPVGADGRQLFKRADKGKGVDRPVNAGFVRTSCAQGSYSFVKSPIVIDKMSDNNDVEPSTQAPSSKSDQTHPSCTAFISKDAGHYEDLYLKSADGKDSMNVEGSPPHNDEVRDLAQSIKGMYRILDLISEQGSGGLVDKIIIAQDSLCAFVNSICPGAYVSVTKVDFSALDRYIVKPVGVYGSKEEIVRLLSSCDIIDEYIAAQLMVSQDDSGVSTPSLRSGVYIVRPACETTLGQQLFLIYWPEDRTWDDSVPSSVRRNRVTFMRYLMKMCDQVIALISPEHAQSITFNNQEGEDTSMVPGEDCNKSSRMFTFEVAKTNEQEEAVKSRSGFKATSKYIHPGATVDAKSLKPVLLHGETVQGFMTVASRPEKLVAEPIKQESMTRIRLGRTLKSDALWINEDLEYDALKLLVDAGLQDRFQHQCDRLGQEYISISSNALCREESEKLKIEHNLKDEEPFLTDVVQNTLVDVITQKYPFIHESFPYSVEISAQDITKVLDDLTTLFPKIGEELHQSVQDLQSENISSRKFKDSKERICIAQYFLRNHPDVHENALNDILFGDVKRVKETLKMIMMRKGTALDEKVKGAVSAVLGTVSSILSSGMDKHSSERMCSEVDPDSISDAQFLVELKDVRMPCIMTKIVEDTRATALEYFKSLLAKKTADLVRFSLRTQFSQCLRQVQREVSSLAEEQTGKVLRKFINEINEISQAEHHSRTLFIKSVEKRRREVYITGNREVFQEPMLEFSVHLMQLTEHDQHTLKLDPSVIPSPKFPVTQSHSFNLPLGHSVVRAQLLSGDRILLATTDRSGDLMLFLDSLTAIDRALAHGRGKKLHRDKMGDFILAFDESKQVLGVIAREKLLLHMYVYDNTRGFQASGRSINLAQWYGEGTSVIHACFVCGSEELLLVDSSATARIYSLTTMQFRPATLNLNQMPTAVYSTPDGSCLITTRVHGSDLILTAYHWSTFGSTDGIPLEISDLPLDQPLSLTSLINRNIVHLVFLDIGANCCRSFALDITRKATEFTFKEKGALGVAAHSKDVTAHNCLIDCHAEVWTRFPVLPAVQRETITSSSDRYPRTLAFITDRDHHLFTRHFHDLISNFERTSKKPTGTILQSLDVLSYTYDVFYCFLSCLLHGADCQVSKFRAGEWLVELLCLIPIHIAVTKENRFVPLKDGVYSSELEKSLLGADVNRIVDHLSFGWYESLFQSYMAKKPVKVVSSMGEQSVGKSFSLNHLVDTSFAGSAMRTTEGVWMSVTPTKHALLVALDFEAVHSIERSAQEDTFLVLFNTAISNLVLFRNNFALNRDITGLFQSFQSSSTVLDPTSSPNLFQSTLTIIIKDVVDSDMAEIAKEFALKFQQIVQEEQEANFISRLHAGQLNIIPWPVIESKEFYKLFPILKCQLDTQKLTHHTAGEFLHVMKMLMAKLKANDWGALSQSMASHRAQLLLTLLPNALAFGLQEVNPDPEPLKNLDDDVPVVMPDTSCEFSLATGGPQQSFSREVALQVLSHAWGDYDSRQHVPEDVWIGKLATHIDGLVNLRIAHVQEWISSNVARFQSGQASIEELMRTFENATVDLKSNVQLCKVKCAGCELFCVQSRLHDEQHDCGTTHSCIHACDFCASSGETKDCSISAGHPGDHICVVTAHLCGEICKLYGRQGCLDECTRVIGHAEGDHLCAATVHACGQPCDLSNLKLADGSTPPCRDTCGIPSDVDHDQHLCDARLCPFPCQLCKRLCANTDHLHGLHSGAIHLCGEEHSCSKPCTADGICEIETSPQSIEATFTGRHETFQYTKYSQVAKRLRCVKLIPPGALTHTGAHTHSLVKKAVHFCTERCEHCGYYCTLPLGHPQQEHETSHGSMSSSRWAVDGPDDAGLEVEGRRFSSNDEGAPMMCNLVCQALGRHVHIDYCRARDASACRGNDKVQHIPRRLLPEPDRSKDFLTHKLFWRRSGFKDPYSREDQANFAKCDAMCSGPEHTGRVGNAAQPSFCTLPLFHVPMNPNTAPASPGYVSNDGHSFSCRKPQQAYHVIFVTDRSSSMRRRDQRPLRNTPASNKIVPRFDNRFGAVLLALYSFWSARAAAVADHQAARRDSYSIILFNDTPVNVVMNDFSRSPTCLLDVLLRYESEGGTIYNGAIQAAQILMEQHWSTERKPVIIFLSDGEGVIDEARMRSLSNAAVRRGKALSFHSVAFGTYDTSILRRMSRIALEIEQNAPRDTLGPATVASSFTNALNTVQLAETFLGIAESLNKPRGSLVH